MIILVLFATTLCKYEYMSKLTWYLPISFDSDTKITRSSNNLIVEDRNSIAGIKYLDGTYLFNTSFKEETACSTFAHDKFFTFSKNGSFGSWDTETGKGLDWNRVYFEEVNFCMLTAISPQKFGLLINQKHLHVITGSGINLWSWSDIDSSRYWSNLFVTSGVIKVVGTTGSAVCLNSFEISTGKLSKSKEICNSARIAGEIFVVLDYAIWITDLNNLQGFELNTGTLLDFQTESKIPEYFGASKAIKKIYSVDLARLLVNVGTGIDFVVDITKDASNLIITFLPLPVNSHKNFYLLSDFSHAIGRIFTDDMGFNIFELIDPLSGKILQQILLEPVFPGNPIKGFLMTSLSTDESYYTWTVLGLDDKGGFFSHKPVYLADITTESAFPVKSSTNNHNEL